MPDIAPANISALLLSMQSQGKAHGTCVKVYTILHSLFKMAYMTDVVPANPMDKVERPRPRKDELKEKDVEAYTTEEVQRILPLWKMSRLNGVSCFGCSLILASGAGSAAGSNGRT